MCTAIAFYKDGLYFGRNLDLYYHYDESVTVIPRNYNLKLKNGKEIFCHLAIMGVATVSGGYPLYYDAVNEKGLCMAGLNFPNSAVYGSFDGSKNNVAPFELIPYILSRCESVGDAISQLENINFGDISFDEKFKNTPLHWLICDKNQTVTVEPTAAGLKIYQNAVGVLTNNPPFDCQLYNLANYMNVTARYPTNRFCGDDIIKPYSLGMGSIGLPGDTSSASRFVRAAFIKQNSVCDNAVSQAFHILKAVEQPRGVTYTERGECEYTLYTSVCDTGRLVYYYTTYDGGVCAVTMQNEDLDKNELVSYPLCDGGGIFYHN